MIESPEGAPSSTILLHQQQSGPSAHPQGAGKLPSLIQFIHWIELQHGGRQLGDINTPGGTCVLSSI